MRLISKLVLGKQRRKPWQAADGLGGNLLGGAAEEGLGEVLGGRGGYGSGFVRLAVLFIL